MGTTPIKQPPTMGEFVEALVATMYRYVGDPVLRETVLRELGEELEPFGESDGDGDLNPAELFWNAIDNQDELLAEGEDE